MKCATRFSRRYPAIENRSALVVPNASVPWGWYHAKMIGSISGVVIAVRPTYCLVSAGGIGYKVASTKDTLARLVVGTETMLWTHLAVREDALDLYGFPGEEELRFFHLLLSVSGIGPKSALGVLDVAGVETLRSAISTNKSEYLTKVAGIGRKTAEKIVLELRDKVGAAIEGLGETLDGDGEALEALRALGYSNTEARDVLRKVPADIKGSSARLKEALKHLGNQ